MLTPSVQVSALQGEWHQAGRWFPISEKIRQARQWACAGGGR